MNEPAEEPARRPPYILGAFLGALWLGLLFPVWVFILLLGTAFQGRTGVDVLNIALVAWPFIAMAGGIAGALAANLTRYGLPGKRLTLIGFLLGIAATVVYILLADTVRTAVWDSFKGY